MQPGSAVTARPPREGGSPQRDLLAQRAAGVPDLKWFREGCGEQVRFLRGMPSRRETGGHRTDWEGPAAWVAGKRKGTAMPGSVTLVWDLDLRSWRGSM